MPDEANTPTLETLPLIFGDPSFQQLPTPQRQAVLDQGLAAARANLVQMPGYDGKAEAAFTEYAKTARAKVASMKPWSETAKDIAMFPVELGADVAKAAGTTAVAGVDALNAVEDPQSGQIAKSYGRAVATGVSKALDSVNSLIDRGVGMFMPAAPRNLLIDDIEELRKKIDDGQFPTGAQSFTKWADEQNAKIIDRQKQFAAQETAGNQMSADEGSIHSAKSVLENPETAKQVEDFVQGRSLMGNADNKMALMRYIATRSPDAWNQLKNGLIKTQARANIDASEEQNLQSEGAKQFDAVFGDGASKHIISAGDPLMVGGFLFPMLRGAKAVAGAERAATFGGRLGQVVKTVPGSAAIGAGFGAAGELEQNPNASAGEVAGSAAKMAVGGSLLHAGVGSVMAALPNRGASGAAAPQAAPPTVEGQPTTPLAPVTTSVEPHEIVADANARHAELTAIPEDQRTDSQKAEIETLARIKDDPAALAVHLNAPVNGLPQEPSPLPASEFAAKPVQPTPQAAIPEAQAQTLRDSGYSDEQISQMAPDQAQRLLQALGKTPAAPEVPPVKGTPEPSKTPAAAAIEVARAVGDHEAAAVLEKAQTGAEGLPQPEQPDVQASKLEAEIATLSGKDGTAELRQIAKDSNMTAQEYLEGLSKLRDRLTAEKMKEAVTPKEEKPAEAPTAQAVPELPPPPDWPLSIEQTQRLVELNGKANDGTSTPAETAERQRLAGQERRANAAAMAEAPPAPDPNEAYKPKPPRTARRMTEVEQVKQSRAFKETFQHDIVSRLQAEVGKIAPPEIVNTRNAKGQITGQDLAPAFKGGEWDWYKDYLDGGRKRGSEGKARLEELHRQVFAPGGIPLAEAEGHLHDALGGQSLGEAITEALASREEHAQQMVEEQKRAEGAGDQQIQQEAAWNAETKKGGKGKKEISSFAINPGDKMVVDGEHVRVTDVLPNGDIVLEDGAKFGRQVIENGDSIFVEKFEPKTKADDGQGHEPPAAAPEPSTGGFQGPKLKIKVPDLPSKHHAELVARDAALNIAVEEAKKAFGSGAGDRAPGALNESERAGLDQIKAQAAKQGWDWKDVQQVAKKQLGLNDEFMTAGSHVANFVEGLRRQAAAFDAAHPEVRQRKFEEQIARGLIELPDGASIRLVPAHEDGKFNVRLDEKGRRSTLNDEPMSMKDAQKLAVDEAMQYGKPKVAPKTPAESLIPEGDMPFNLVGETAQEKVIREAKEKAAEAKTAAAEKQAAAAEMERRQTKLFSDPLMLNAIETAFRDARDFVEFTGSLVKKFGLWIADHAQALWDAIKKGGTALKDYLKETWQRSEIGTAGPHSPEEIKADLEAAREKARIGLSEASMNAAQAEEGSIPMLKNSPIKNQAVIDSARAREAAEPGITDRLIDKLSRAKNREPINREDIGLLAVRAVDLKRAALANEAIHLDPNSSPEAKAEAAQRAAALSDEQYKLRYLILAGTGEAGGVLQFARNLLDEDYSVERMRLAREGTKGEPLTDAEKERVKAQADTIKQRDAEIERLNMKIEELQTKPVVDEITKQVDQERKTGTGTKGKNKPFDGARINDALVKLSKDNPSLDAIPDSLLDKIARFHIQNGVTDVNDLVTKIRQTLEPHIKGITDSDVRTALTKYGQVKFPSQEEVSKKLRDYKAQMLLLQKIQTVEKELTSPKATGLRRDKLSAEARDLNKKLSDVMREHNIQVTDPKTQLANSRAAIVTRLNNQIEDLQRVIDGKSLPRNIREKVVYDQEMKDLQKRRDDLKEVVDAMHRDPVKDAAQWNKNAEKAARAAEDEYNRRIRELDFANKKAPSHAANEELKKARADRDAARENFQQLKESSGYAGQMRLDALKKRLQDRIDEVKNRLITGEKPDPSRPTPTDADTVVLKAELDRLNEAVRAIEGTKGLTEEQRSAAAERSTEKQIAKVEEQIKSGDFNNYKRPSPEETQKLRDLREHLALLKEIKDAAKEAQNPRPTPLQLAQARTLRAIERATEEYNRRIREKDYSPRKSIPTPVNAAIERARALREDAIKQYEADKVKDRMAKMHAYEKAFDHLSGIGRGFKNSHIVTLGKIIIYSLQNLVSVPLRELQAIAMQHVPGFRRIMEKAGVEGHASFTSVADFFHAFFTSGMKDATANFKRLLSAMTFGGLGDAEAQSTLKALHDDHVKLPPHWYDAPQLSHEVLKSPLLRAGYEMAKGKLERAAVANGESITDPTVRDRIENEAYAHGKRMILMADNLMHDMVKAGIQRLDRVDPTTGHTPFVGKAGAYAVRSIFTFVKVAANHFVEMFNTVLGAPVSAARTTVAHFQNALAKSDWLRSGDNFAFRLANSMARSMEDMPEKDANSIVRQMKAGLYGIAAVSFGAAMPMMFGGLNPHKRRGDGELGFGEMEIAGVRIPRWVTFASPHLLAMQLGATFSQTLSERKKNKTHDPKELSDAIESTALGLLETGPIVNETVRASRIGDTGGLRTYLQNWATSNFYPGFMVEMANAFDKDAHGKTTKRVEGDFLSGDFFKARIPFLRNELPVKPPVHHRN